MSDDLRKPEHTPTPWRFLDGSVQGPAKYNIGGYVDVARCEQFFHERDHLRSIAPNRAECAANAAFIVMAVNSHDALVNVLTDARNALASLPMESLGYASDPMGEQVHWPIRDELLHRINEALGAA